MDKEKLREEILDLCISINQGCLTDNDLNIGINIIVETVENEINIKDNQINALRKQLDQEKPKINIFYDEIKKVLDKYYIIKNETDCSAEILKELSNLYDIYYNQTKKNYVDMIEKSYDFIKVEQEILKNENKSLNQDINLLVAENEKLKTKIKMNKILMEYE